MKIQAQRDAAATPIVTSAVDQNLVDLTHDIVDAVHESDLELSNSKLTGAELDDVLGEIAKIRAHIESGHYARARENADWVTQRMERVFTMVDDYGVVPMCRNLANALHAYTETTGSVATTASLTWTTPADDWIAAYGEQGGFGFSAEITEADGGFKVRISEDGTEVALERVSGSLEEAKAHAEALVTEFDQENDY